MIDIKNFAEQLEEKAISKKEERLIELFIYYMFEPYTKLGEIREVLDSTSIEELKEILDELLLTPGYFDESDDSSFGQEVILTIPLKSIWSNNASYYLWQKLKKEQKRRFF